MRLVIDTNVLLSAMMSPASPSARVFNLWRSRNFDLLTTTTQLDEITRVTRYPRVRSRVTPARAGALVNRVRDLPITVEKLPRVTRCPDPDDNYLLALAETGKADFLITGDKELLDLKRHKSTRIVTPAALVALFEI